MSGEERNGQVKKEKKGLRMQVVFCDPLILLFHYVSRNRPDQKFKLWVLKTFRHIKVDMRNSQSNMSTFLGDACLQNEQPWIHA